MIPRRVTEDIQELSHKTGRPVTVLDLAEHWGITKGPALRRVQKAQDSLYGDLIKEQQVSTKVKSRPFKQQAYNRPAKGFSVTVPYPLPINAP